MEEIKKSGAGHSEALDHVSGQAAGADDSGGKKKKEKKKTVGQEILSLLCYLGIVLILTFLIVNFVGCPHGSARDEYAADTYGPGSAYCRKSVVLL